MLLRAHVVGICLTGSRTSLNGAAGSCSDHNCMFTVMFSAAKNTADRNVYLRHRIDKNAGVAHPLKPPSSSLVSTVLQPTNDVTSQKEWWPELLQTVRQSACGQTLLNVGGQ